MALLFVSKRFMHYVLGIIDAFILVALYSFDELLVSAPLYRADSTEPETGRVYLYRNNQV